MDSSLYVITCIRQAVAQESYKMHVVYAHPFTTARANKLARGVLVITRQPL